MSCPVEALRASKFKNNHKRHLQSSKYRNNLFFLQHGTISTLPLQYSTKLIQYLLQAKMQTQMQPKNRAKQEIVSHYKCLPWEQTQPTPSDAFCEGLLRYS